MKNVNLLILFTVVISASSLCNASVNGNDMSKHDIDILAQSSTSILNLNDSELINLWMTIGLYFEDDLKVHIEAENLNMTYDLNDRLKTSVLMSFLRMSPARRIPDIDDDFFEKRSLIEIYSKKNPDRKISIDANFYRNMILRVSLKNDDGGIYWNLSNKLIFGKSTFYYGKELLDQIRLIVKNRNIGYESNFSSVENFALDDALYENVIINNTIVNDTSELIFMYDFICRNWNSSAKISYYDERESTDGFTINGDKLRSLLISMMRVGLNIGEFANAYSFEHFATKDGAIYKMSLNISGSPKYIIYIKDGYNNFVGIRRMGETKDDSIDVIPSDGSYYSPELYRIVTSLFSDIIRIYYFDRKSI